MTNQLPTPSSRIIDFEYTYKPISFSTPQPNMSQYPFPDSGPMLNQYQQPQQGYPTSSSMMFQTSIAASHLAGDHMQRSQSAVDFSNLTTNNESNSKGDVEMATVTVIRPNGPLPGGQPAENTNELPRPYKCRVCDMAFDRDELTRHLSFHRDELIHPKRNKARSQTYVPSPRAAVRPRLPSGLPSLHVVGSQGHGVRIERIAATFKCNYPDCQKGPFKRQEHLKRHKTTEHAENPVAIIMPCPFCDRQFNRKDNYLQHLKLHTEKHRPTRTDYHPEAKALLDEEINKTKQRSQLKKKSLDRPAAGVYDRPTVTMPALPPPVPAAPPVDPLRRIEAPRLEAPRDPSPDRRTGRPRPVSLYQDAPARLSHTDDLYRSRDDAQLHRRRDRDRDDYRDEVMARGFGIRTDSLKPEQPDRPARSVDRRDYDDRRVRREAVDPGRPAAPTGSGASKKDADGKFPCPYCTKTYVYEKDLKRHLLRHTGLPYMCMLCGYGSSRRDHLNRHS
ncbi:hypothetical protein F5Y06DRAFT_305448 [Hypoxylon sp. FL0890]|nr:hypothetical protein F5Y06DRAFT_305448 [Hypoxylon sp. FL0890]